MLCLPGFRPLAADVQAGGVSAGSVERSGACTPSRMSRPIVGSTPDCAHGSIRSKVRSEEHTSELQSRPHLVCRLLLEKKKKKKYRNSPLKKKKKKRKRKKKKTKK